MTAIEWLINQLEKKGGASVNVSINRMQISIKEEDYFCLIEQAKEIEKETLHQVWKASEQNMRSQFSSSAYKNITFEDHYEALRSKKY